MHRRYRLALPVRIKPKSRSGPVIETSSKDLSARGIYLVLSENLELGSELDLEITLPEEISGGNIVKLRCRGKVARLEPRDAEGKIGVGAVIQSYKFFHEAKLKSKGA
jgi:PilZ domain-containing protein